MSVAYAQVPHALCQMMDTRISKKALHLDPARKATASLKEVSTKNSLGSLDPATNLCVLGRI